jgi:hypothetical protein
VKGKIATFGKHIDRQSQAIYFAQKKKSIKSLHILEDGANDVQLNILSNK